MANNQIIVRGEIAKGIIKELIGLCVGGWLEGDQIQGAVLSYSVDFSEACQLKILTKKTGPLTKEAHEELMCLVFGLFAMGIEFSAEGAFFDHDELREALVWIERQSQDQFEVSQTIHPNSHLTLVDLGTIHDLLTDQVETIEALEGDSGFAREFPLVDIYNGCYGNMRHKSGHEVFINWQENKFAKRHKIDAANPGFESCKRYRCERDGKRYRRPQKNVSKAGPYGYRKSVENRWKVAYMLGSIPAECKSRVYAWVVQVFNSVDFYHDTRGGAELPSIFSIEFGDYRMTATHDFVFRVEGCGS